MSVDLSDLTGSGSKMPKKFGKRGLKPSAVISPSSSSGVICLRFLTAAQETASGSSKVVQISRIAGLKKEDRCLVVLVTVYAAFRNLARHRNDGYLSKLRCVLIRT